MPDEELWKNPQDPKERKTIDEEVQEVVAEAVERKQRDLKIARILRWTGNTLIILSIVGLFFTFWPVFSAEVGYRVDKLRGVRYLISSEEPSAKKQTFGDLLGRASPKVIIPQSTDFGLVVEKINANAPVIANVNAANKAEYNGKLQKGIAHAAGTVFPGQNGLTFLFSHSVLNPWDVPRYNAVFYLLRELQPGDRIITYFAGKRFDYFVTEKKIVSPDDVSVLRANPSKPLLVLQTCDPPGTTWRRLLVFAEMKEAGQ